MIQGWKYYNHAMIPTTAPHENVLLDPVERGKCLKYRGGVYRCLLDGRQIGIVDMKRSFGIQF